MPWREEPGGKKASAVKMAPPGRGILRSERWNNNVIRCIKKVVFDEEAKKTDGSKHDEALENEAEDRVKSIKEELSRLRRLTKRIVRRNSHLINNNLFQSNVKMATNESINLLANDGDASTQGSPSKGEGEKEWQCGYCPSTYKRRGWLNKHVEKDHAELIGTFDNTLTESQFVPIKNSTVEQEEEDKSKKRKTRDGDEDEKDRGAIRKIKLEKVEEKVEKGEKSEESEEDDEDTETQQIIKKTIKTRQEVDMFLQSFNEEDDDLDKSLEMDKDRQITELRRLLKEKTKLVYIKDGQLTEKDIQIQDLEEDKSSLTLEVKKLKEKEAVLQREMDDQVKRTEVIHEKSGKSPSKVTLKNELLMMTDRAETLKEKARLLEIEVKKEKDESQRLGKELAAVGKVQASLEEATAQVDNVKEELDKKERVICQLKKKIPCDDKDCTRGKRCAFAHHLEDRRRSRSRVKEDKKHLQCNYFKAGHCKKPAEKCQIGHFLTNDQMRDNNRAHDEEEMDTEESYLRIENQRFRGNNQSNGSVEYLGSTPRQEAQQNNNSFRGGANRYPSPNNNEDGRDRRNPRPEDSRPVERRRSDNEMSGNGRGDRARSRPRSPRREDGTRSNYSRDSFQRADIRQEDRYCRGGQRMTRREERGGLSRRDYERERSIRERRSREDSWRREEGRRERSRSRRERDHSEMRRGDLRRFRR